MIGSSPSPTFQSTPHYRDYVQWVGRFPLLKPAQELMLGKQIQEGLAENATPRQIKRKDKAIQKLVNCNLRLVIHLAKQRHRPGMDIMDMIGAGNIGLVRSCEKYDYTLGYKFSTYAYWWIRQAINRDMENNRHTIRLPVNAQQLHARIERYKSEFLASNGEMPTKEQIYLGVGIKPERQDQLATEVARRVVSIDAPVSGSKKKPNSKDKDTLENFASAIIDCEEESYMDSIKLDGYKELIEAASLSQTEKVVLHYSFGFYDGERWSVQKISKRLGGKWKQNVVRNARLRALKKLVRQAKLLEIKKDAKVVEVDFEARQSERQGTKPLRPRETVLTYGGAIGPPEAS